MTRKKYPPIQMYNLIELGSDVDTGLIYIAEYFEETNSNTERMPTKV